MRSLIVAGENWINDQNTYTCASGQALAPKLYDQKPSTKLISTGSSEGSGWTVEIEFKDRDGAAVARTLDCLIFLATNMARGYVEYWDGAAWQTIAESVFGAGTENDSANVIVELAASVTTLKLRVTITHTIGAAAEKYIGELKACLLAATVRHKVDFPRDGWSDGGDYRLQGGQLVTFVNVVKLEAEVTIDQVTKATRDILKPLVDARGFMTWILWSDFEPADVYELAAASEMKERLDRKTQLYTLSFMVKER